MIELKEATTVVFFALGALSLLLLVAFCIMHLVIRKNFSENSRVSDVSMQQVFEFKRQMQDEQTKNHQFDETKEHNAKIAEGTRSLNDYKINNDTSICENYRMG